MDLMNQLETDSQLLVDNQIEIRRNSYDENLKKFRELLMIENINIVAKLKKYKKTDFRRKIVLDQLKELKKLSELSKVWVSVPFVKQKYDHPVITVDSSKAGSNIDALRLAVHDLGWKEYPNGCNGKSCHVVWNSCNFNENRNNNGSFVNKHPGITQCLHKVAFSRILETMRTLFPNHYSFYPLTWYLPHQMVEFSLYCKNREAANKNDKYYIVKPDAGTQGEGIYLIQKPQDYKLSSRTFVVQEYLANPLLLDGYKFDLRIYAILLGLDPLKIYLCNEGLARFCTKRYVPPSSDNLNISFMHLTNYSLNKKSNEFVHTQNLDSGSKRTVSSVFAVLEADGYEVSTIWKKLEELVYKTILAIVPQLKVHYINEILVKNDSFFSGGRTENTEERPSCFQILGFDVLIMNDLNPILLEVNSNPSMRLDCEMEIAPGICEYYVSKVDVKIKKPLVRDTLKLLEPEICRKFNLEMTDSQKLRDWSKRTKDCVRVKNSGKNSRANSSISDKESVSEICRKWSTESEFGPHFIEIAKKNNTLPKNFEVNRPNSENELLNGIKTVKIDENSEIQVTISGTSPKIRKKQQQRRYNQLAKEKSWLQLSKIEKESNDTTEEDDSYEAQDDQIQEKLLDHDSCLSLISTESYNYLFDDLRILEETTIIFYNSMGHRYSENMGATAFRTFGRQCKLHVLGFNHAMIDLIYIEVQRRWAFTNNFDSKQGLCYQAFLEAFFRIAFAKFNDVAKAGAVQNLIDHCKRSIGSSNFNWSRTLNPTTYHKENESRKQHFFDSTKRYKVLESQNNVNRKSDAISASSGSSSENINTSNNNENIKEKRLSSHQTSVQSRYELMKAIHEIYRKKIQKSNQSKLNSNSSNDSDSVKSLPTKKAVESSTIKKSKLPYLSKNMNNLSASFKESLQNSNKSHVTYNYESPEVQGKYQDDLFEKKSTLVFRKEIKPSHEIDSPSNNKAEAYSAYKVAENAEKIDKNKFQQDRFSGKIKKSGSRNSKSYQLSPINSDRMKKLISVYGADSQDFLKRSLDKMNRKFPILKPL